MLFEAPRLKVVRARRHLTELQSQVAVYLGKTPFRAVIEHDGPGRQRLTFRVRKPVPTELSAIIGDAIHNLRAALDLLACELVRLNGGSDEDVYFPFAADSAAFERMLKERHIDRAGPAVVAHMRGLRAYKGGNVPLRALHDLDITDKHQMLLPVAEYANFGDASFGGTAAISVGSGTHLGPVQEGFTLFRFPTDPKLRVGQVIKTKYKLTLGPLLPLSTQDLVSAINVLAKLVTDIIDSFETVVRPPAVP